MSDIPRNFLKSLKSVAQKKQDIVTDEVSNQIDKIEAYLMKRGTLSAHEIDWKDLKKLSDAILKSTLHISALRAYVLCLTEGEEANSSSTLDAGQIILSICTDLWKNIVPRGNKYIRRQKAYAEEMFNAFIKSTEKNIQTNNLPPKIDKNVDQLIRAAKKLNIDETGLIQLKADIRAKGKKQKEKPPRSETTRTDDLSSEKLDAKGRADLRNAISSLANRIGHYYKDAGLPYHMRGFAAWLEFPETPEADTEGVTAIEAMPAFVSDEHIQAARNPSVISLKNLENRLSMSPDWFEGQMIAHKMALDLELPNVAQAIQLRVSKRLSELPGLRKLKYTNNTPIVADRVLEWATGVTEHSAPMLEKTSNEENPNINARKLNFEDAVKDLNGRLEHAKSLRQISLIKLEFANLLLDHKCVSHASLILDEVEQYFEDQLLQKWDTEFVEDIKALKKRL